MWKRKTADSSASSLILLFLFAACFFPGAAMAQDAGGAGKTQANLDLSSVSASLSASNKSPVSIQVGGTLSRGTISGGTQMTIAPGQFVTPAQNAVASAGGQQTLLLNQQGAAAGGSLTLNSSNLQNFGALVVPSGVSLNAIGYNSASPLNVSGNLNIAGSMFSLQNAPNIMSVLNIGNLNLGQGGLLSAYLPAGLNSTGLFSSAGMRLNVAGNVLNQGTITSPGALNIVAGGNIVNQTVNNVQAAMTAQNINLVSGAGNFVNSGLIQAMNTLNLNTLNQSTRLIVDNTDGVLEALGAINPSSGIFEDGVINIRENGPEIENANAGIWGGRLSAAGGINMFGKDMTAFVEQIDGPISNTGSAAHIYVRTGELVLGPQALSGDPTYYNDAGNVTMGDLTAVGGDIAIVASGDVNWANPTTAITAGANQDIYVAAGVNFTVTGLNNSKINWNGPDDPGDSLALLTITGTGNGSINTSGNVANLIASGTGTITMLAAGNGSITLGAGTISTVDGDILLVSGTGGIPATAGAVTATGTGNITIASATANGLVGSTIFNGTPSAIPTVGAKNNGNIVLGAPVVTNTGDLNVSTDGSLTTSTITVTDKNVGLLASSVNLNGPIDAGLGAIVISASNGNVSDTGGFPIAASSLTLSAANGSVGPITSAVNGSLTVTATGLATSTINIANTGNLSSFDVTAPVGTNGFILLNNTGNVTLDSNLNGPLGVELGLSGVGSTLNYGTNTITTNNSTISLFADALIGSGSINAGTGFVQILPASLSRIINIAGGTGGLDISAAQLGAITASNLVIGSNLATGAVNVGTVDISAQFNLQLFGGPMNFNGSLTANNRQLDITAGGNISGAGSITVGSGLLNVFASGDINLATAVNGGTLIAGAAGGLSGDITISNTGSIVSLTASTLALADSITISSTGNVTLNSISGINGTGGVSITLDPLTTLDLNGASVLSDRNINLTADTLQFNGGLINAASRTVTLAPARTNRVITIGAGLGSGLNLTQADLDSISAGTLVIGSSAMTGGIVVDAPLVIAQGYNVTFRQGDVALIGFDSIGNSIGVGANDFSVILNSGDIRVDDITNPNGSVLLQTNGADSEIDLGINHMPNAHSISVLANLGSINFSAFTPGAITITPNQDGSGNGGSVFLSAANLRETVTNTATPHPMVLDVSSLTGNGGTASWTNTDSTAFNNPLSTQLQLNISAANNQGSAVISTGGDLTINQTNNVILTSLVFNGNGPGFNFVAGNQIANPATQGKLLVIGALNASGFGDGTNGGSITLGSNSLTVFNIGATATSNTNGIRGSLQVNAGGVGGANGSISVFNRGGGITSSTQALTAVGDLTFDSSAATAGKLTITKALGDQNTNSIFLAAGGTGTVALGTLAVTGNSIDLASGTGAISGSKLSTAALSANTGGTAAVTLTNIRSVPLLTLNNSKSGGNFTLKNTGADSGFNVSGNLISLNETSGTILLTASGTGDFTNPAGPLSVNFIRAKTVRLTSATGDFGTGTAQTTGLRVQTASLALNTSPGLANINNLGFNTLTMNITAAKTNGTFTVFSTNAVKVTPAIANVSSVEINTSAGAGGITVAGMGNTTSTAGITLSTGAGSITGGRLTTNPAGSVTLTTSSGQIGTPTVALKLNTDDLTVTPSVTAGLININNTRTGAITVNTALQSTGNITFTSAGQPTFMGDISGSTVTLKTVGSTAFNGGITATGGVKLTQTGIGPTAMAVGKNISAATTVSLQTVGATTFNDITAGSTVTITQGGTGSGSSFGAINGSNVTLTLRNANLIGGVNFNGAITASGAFKLTESGTGSTNMAAGNITAATTVTITTVGDTSFNDITASAGNLRVSTKGSSNFGTVSAGVAGTVTLTQTGGNNFTLAGGSAAGSTFTASSTGTGLFSTTGAVQAAKTVSLKSSGAGTSISIGGDVIANDATAGTANLTANGAGSITRAAGTIQASTVNLRSGSGALGAVGLPLLVSATKLAARSTGLANFSNTGTAPLTLTAATTNGNPFTLVSNGAVSTTQTLANASSITINTSSGAGGITLLGAALGGANKTNTIALTTNSGSITGNGTLSTNDTGSVTLATSSGNYGTNTAPIKTNSPNITTGSTSGFINLSSGRTGGSAFAADIVVSLSLTLKTSGGATSFGGDLRSSLGAVKLTQTGSGSTTFAGNIVAGTDVSISTVGNTNFAAGKLVAANNGGLTVTQSTGTMNIGAGAQFSAISTTGNPGRITLLEKADKAGSGIIIGNGAILFTFDTTKAETTFPLSGQITVVVGSSVPAPVDGIQPLDVAVDLSGATGPANKVYWGKNDSFAISLPANTLAVQGNTAIQFQSGLNAPITFGGDTDWTADPPAPTPAQLLMIQQGQSILNNGSVPGSTLRPLPIVRFALDRSLAVLTGFQPAPAPSPAAIPGFSSNPSSVPLVQTPNQHQPATPQVPAQTAPKFIMDPSYPRTLEAELSDSENIDEAGISIASDKDLGLALNAGWKPALPGKLLNGNFIFAPFIDTRVETPFGNIDIDAKSIAFVFASEQGVAVFNLDDQHRDAVRIHSGMHKFALSPGRHVLLTSNAAKSFEQVNAAEAISYRNITELELGAGFKAFKSEFSIPSAISAIKPLKSLLNSKNPEAIKLKSHLIKTVAAMFQMKPGSERFQQFLRLRMAAYNN